ncbi:hypothetical protein T439DRAFT_58844 [Meredithblackwellia eburnea MCA 4105]
MSQSTPTRPTYASPPSISRNFSLNSQSSSVSSSRGGSPTAGSSAGGAAVGAPGSDKKRRARTLLRDYYGLASSTSSSNASENGAAARKKGDPMDIDSPTSFNPELYFTSLSSTASIPDLLKRENELINEIRELDGERQSLVYNHHSELIDASDTIRKMKSRALLLDASLDNLKASFESISQLSTSLAGPSSLNTPTASSSSSTIPPLAKTATAVGPPITPPRRRSGSTTNQTPTSVNGGKRLSTLLETPTTAGVSNGSPPEVSVKFDPLVHLPALLSLPLLLRVSDKKAELWGQWEPALRSWEEEGVHGVREVGNECREALKEGRRNSLSNHRTE